MITIVLPVYNEEEVLAQLYERLTAAAQSWGEDYEVLVVDDGSTDNSAEMLQGIHWHDPRWKVLTFSRNFGHQSAVSAGIHYSTGDAVVVMDADLQDPPEELRRFLDKWREGYQVVYAIRANRKESVLKRFAYAAFYRVLRRIASIEIPLDSGDFCVMDRQIVDVLRALPERARFVRGLRSWAGFRQIGITYDRPAREAGRTKYRLSMLMRLAFDGLLSFSNVPLRIAGWLGGAFCLLSVLLTAALIVWWASDVSVFGMHPSNAAGWTSLCSLLLMLSGIQMLVIGVIGEYLARVFDEVKAREPWIISSASGFQRDTIRTPVGWHVAENGRQASRQAAGTVRRAG